MEKLALVESILNVAEFSLKEEDYLEDIVEWNEETIERFHDELISRGKDIDIEELKECERVVELCRLI